MPNIKPYLFYNALKSNGYYKRISYGKFPRASIRLLGKLRQEVEFVSLQTLLFLLGGS